jgi:predicted ATP-binding protein involved in virulence
MYLKSITLHNFRCFDDLTLELHPRLTVLIAENAGGKTSVLDAIAIALAPLLKAFSSAAQRIGGDDDPLPHFKDTDFRLISPPKGKGSVSWIPAREASLTITTTDGLSWTVARNSTDPSQGHHDDIAVPPSLAALAASQDQLIRDGRDWLLPVVAYYGANRGTFEIPERIRETKVAYDFPTAAFVGALNPQTDFKEILKWFDAAEAAELRAFRDFGQSGDPEVGPEPNPALDCVRGTLSILLGNKYSNPRLNERRKLVVDSNPDSLPQCPDQGDLFPRSPVLQVSQLSQGYQSMLALGMDFARRMATANPGFDPFEQLPDSTFTCHPAIRSFMGQYPPSNINDNVGEPCWAPAIMLIDEIDLHLHPSWQQRVLPDLMRAFPATQFIVTTHSPQVLTTVKRENIRMLAKTPSGKWQARMPDRNPYAHANSVALESVMGGQAYPPSTTLDQLREYQRLVGSDEHDSPRAIELRRILEGEWGQSDPELAVMDITIRKNETLRKLRSQKP